MSLLMHSKCWFFACKISNTRHHDEGKGGRNAGLWANVCKIHNILYRAIKMYEGVFHFQKTRSQNKFGATPSITAFPGKSERALLLPSILFSLFQHVSFRGIIHCCWCSRRIISIRHNLVWTPRFCSTKNFQHRLWMGGKGGKKGGWYFTKIMHSPP